MLNTKLILIEGLPGSGKSTTTAHLGTALRQNHVACRWFLEEDEPHPIPCLDFAIHGLAGKMIPLWQDFTSRALPDPGVTILESRLWQNTALYMFMSEVAPGEILQYYRRVCEILGPLAPALVYLDQPDTDAALRQLAVMRGDNWMAETLAETTGYPWFQTRGLSGFTGWVRFFEEWRPVAEHLYADWPYGKVRILDPHADWARAFAKLDEFLKVAT